MLFWMMFSDFTLKKLIMKGMGEINIEALQGWKSELDSALRKITSSNRLKK